MKSIDKTESGLWIACFPYFSLGKIRHAVSECLKGRWIVLPVKGDSKAAELYRQKLEAYGLEARSICNGSSAVAVPGEQVEKLVAYGVGKLKQNMAGIPWEPDDFDREWLDAGRLTKPDNTEPCSWLVTADTLSAPQKIQQLKECYGTSTAFVHDEEGSWTVLYTYHDGILLRIAGELPNLAQWMETAIIRVTQTHGVNLHELLAQHQGLSSDDRICHGYPCFSKTRVPVHVVLEYLKAGVSAQEILKKLPYLRKKDLHAAYGFIMDLKRVIDTLPQGLEDKLESIA